MRALLSKFSVLLLIALLSYGSLSMAEKKYKLSLEQACEVIQDVTDAKVLSARTIRDPNGYRLHRIKVLTSSGRIRIVKIPDRISSNRSFNEHNIYNQFNGPDPSMKNNSNNFATPKASLNSTTQSNGGTNQK